MRTISRLVADTPRRAEVEVLARQHTVEAAVRQAVLWRPWMLERADVEGLEHLDEARALGRGVILMFAHVGTRSQSPPLLHQAYKLYIVEGGRFLREPCVGRAGYEWLVAKRRLEEAGGRFIVPPDAHGLCQALVERGEICSMAFDVAGRNRTTFGGKPVGVRGGLARLAMDTRAPVVPVFGGRRGHRFYSRLQEWVDPDGFDSVEDLIDQLAAVIGRDLMARPAECEHTKLIHRMGKERSAITVEAK